MKRLFKWLFILALVAVAAVVGLLLSKDAILKAAVEQQIRAQTGMDAKIGRLSLGLLSPVVTIENLTLHNTAEFGGTPFLDVRELHLEFDRDALAKRKLKITLLRLNLEELTVVRNPNGTTNIAALNTPEAAKPTRLAGDVEFKGVDVLNLSLGKIQLIDLKEPRNNRIRNVNLQNQVFHNVRTPGDFYGVLILLWMRSGGSGFISGTQY
ncbi:MAG TPA: hypothetical protein VFZ59_20605 [Verrucomicrobiae bacterium]|nr:hypothetical protein [Verrucomicrobiae bacterium]